MPPRTWLFFDGTLCARDVPVGVPKLIVHTLFIRPGRTLSRCAHGMTQAQSALIPELAEEDLPTIAAASLCATTSHCRSAACIVNHGDSCPLAQPRLGP